MKTKVRYCMSTVRIIIILYKGNFEKYKGKFLKLLFWNFKTLNLFKSCSNALVYIPEVIAHFLTPILPYIWLEFFVGPFFQLQMSRNWRYIFGSKWPKNQKIIFPKVVPCFSVIGTSPYQKEPSWNPM